jgi:NADH:ubiquinone oxidoreductase subunit 5 (subunit L)/multisubunit Na+/H+ antiporter MnhA subunit
MLFAALAAATLAIVGALAVAAFSKCYGLICLGQPRSEAARKAKEPSWIMLGPMTLLAALCALIGVFPSPALRVAFAAAGDVAHITGPAALAGRDEWSGLLGVIGLLGAGVCILSVLLWSFRGALLGRRKVSAGPTWGCGFTAPTTRMQYTGSSYSVATARVFMAFLKTEEEIQPPIGYWPAQASFKSQTPDPALERWLPVIVAKCEDWLSVPRHLQRGRLQNYLLYVSAFLVAVLLWKL